MSFLRSGRRCYAILYCFVWFYYLCVLLMEFYPFNDRCFCRNTLVAMVTKVVLFYIREDFIFCMFCIINSTGQRQSRLLVPLVIKFVSDMQQVGGYSRVLWFPPRYNWNIVESGIKHHNPKPYPLLKARWTRYVVM
jgi:hypothetical protein